MLKNFIHLILIIGFIEFSLNIYICEARIQTEDLRLAEEYKQVYPVDLSPKPGIIQDREHMESVEKAEANLKKQKQLVETEQKELISTKEITTFVGSEPTKIYYQIAVNDRLYISVWRVPDLSLEFIVGPDGKISFPLIGDIQAAGKALSELKAEITEKLKVYIENPQVSVMVRQFAGDKLTVIGEVRSPGIYKFVGKTNIIDVVALAGGFTDRAKSASLVIVRQPKDPTQNILLIPVDIRGILKGNLSKNITVEPNDIIYVSRTFVSNVKEFYDNWITPTLRSAIDYETFKSLRRTRLK